MVAITPELEAPVRHVVSDMLVSTVNRLLGLDALEGGTTSQFHRARSVTSMQGPDCFAIALACADNLGPEFSSEDPHALAGRGDDWFYER